MSVRRVKAGTTDVSVVIRIVDSTDGTPETGVVFNTSGIDLWYRREGAASTDITEATLAALTTAHTDGGFLHINDGWYRLDLPDAACAAGVSGVQIGGTVTGMVVFAPYIELPVNTEEDVYTRLGAPAGASIAADLAAIEAQTDDIGAAGAGLLAVPWNAAWDAEVQSEVADALAVYDPPTNAEMEARTLLAASYATAADLATVAGYIDTEVAAIKAKTDQLTFTTANQVDATTVTNSDKTGYSLAADFRIKKNTALANFPFVMVDSADHVTPKTGLTITAQRSLDGAAFAACANAVAELSNGVYVISLATTDLNADTVTLRFTAAGADDRLISLITQTE